MNCQPHEAMLLSVRFGVLFWNGVGEFAQENGGRPTEKSGNGRE